MEDALSSEGETPLRVARGQLIGARDHQEDSIRVFSDTRGILALVADGMGGEAAGDVASCAAADGFLIGFSARADDEIDEKLARGLRAGNKSVADALIGGRGGAGMGCTLAATYADAGQVSWISVGDSPIFLWHRGKLQRISADHSMAPVLDKMARDGLISWSEAKSDNDRHALRSAVRGGAIELTDQGSAGFPDGAVLLIASDGIEVLSDEAIAHHIANADGDMDALISTLLTAVTAADSPDQDNVSLVAIGHRMNPTDHRGASTDHHHPIWRIPAIIGIGALLAITAFAGYIIFRSSW